MKWVFWLQCVFSSNNFSATFFNPHNSRIWFSGTVILTSQEDLQFGVDVVHFVVPIWNSKCFHFVFTNQHMWHLSSPGRHKSLLFTSVYLSCSCSRGCPPNHWGSCSIAAHSKVSEHFQACPPNLGEKNLPSYFLVTQQPTVTEAQFHDYRIGPHPVPFSKVPILI